MNMAISGLLEITIKYTFGMLFSFSKQDEKKQESDAIMMAGFRRIADEICNYNMENPHSFDFHFHSIGLHASAVWNITTSIYITPNAGTSQRNALSSTWSTWFSCRDGYMVRLRNTTTDFIETVPCQNNILIPVGSKNGKTEFVNPIYIIIIVAVVCIINVILLLLCIKCCLRRRVFQIHTPNQDRRYTIDYTTNNAIEADDSIQNQLRNVSPVFMSVDSVEELTEETRM